MGSVPKTDLSPPSFCTMSRVSEKPYFAYVLWSVIGERFYIGITENPTHRVEQHNAGKSQWTARYIPWRLVHVEKFVDYRAARKREIELKRQKGGKGFYKLVGRSFADLTNAVKPTGS